MNIRNQQSGFTLIELVVVIVILGILAATAVPKFIDLQSDAYESTLEGVKASMQSAGTMVHSKSIIKGNQNLPFSLSPPNTVNIGDGAGLGSDGELYIAYGYPVGNISEWQRIIDIDEDFSYLSDGTSGGGFIIYPKPLGPPPTLDSPCLLKFTEAQGEYTPPLITINACE